MKIEEVEKLDSMERFLYWIKERHQIYKKRKAGKLKPWTDDKVLQENFFTNPYRENDKVTVWFRENIREPLREDPRVLMATIIFRWFNYIPTGELLVHGPYQSSDYDNYGWLEDWKEKDVIKRLDQEREAGKKVFTGAFMINSPPGRPKLEAVCDRIEGNWKDRVGLLQRIEDCMTLQEAHKHVMKYPGLGGFMAYEVVCDLRYTYLLKNATDKMTWCNPGPGAVRGIYRVLDISFQKGKNASSPPKPKKFNELLIGLLSTARKKLKMSLELREIEHSLCEFDKYERARLGDGRMKRKYNAS